MGKVVELGRVRRRRQATAAFAHWPKRVGHRPGPEDRLAELPGKALSLLAELGPQASLALYDVVLGVRGWGPGDAFQALPALQKVQALDSYLFLADQVRYELMRRLGWLSGFAGEVFPLLKLAADNLTLAAEVEPRVPVLSRQHPCYGELERRLQIEPLLVIRSLIPEALTIFRRRLAASPDS